MYKKIYISLSIFFLLYSNQPYANEWVAEYESNSIWTINKNEKIKLIVEAIKIKDILDFDINLHVLIKTNQCIDKLKIHLPERVKELHCISDSLIKLTMKYPDMLIDDMKGDEFIDIILTEYSVNTRFRLNNYIEMYEEVTDNQL